MGLAAAAVVYERNGRFLFSNVVPFELGAAFSPDNKTWVNICRVGVWEGHPIGRLKFDRSDFSRMIDRALQRATPINFDYEHQTFMPGVTGPVASAGLIEKLEVRGDRLWAFVAFTQRAADMIRAGEYRSCSVVVNLDAIDRATNEHVGPELLSVALTNDPFIDGLHPIKLTRTAAMADNTTQQQDQNKQDQNQSGQQPAGDGKQQQDQKQMAANPPQPPAAADSNAPVDTPAEENAEGPDAASLLQSIADAAGMSPDAVLGVLLDQIDAVTNLVTQNSGNGLASEQAAAARRVGVDAQVIELRHVRTQNAALAREVKKLTDLVAKREREAAEEADRVKANAIAEKVKRLADDGYVGDSEQEIADAIALFTHQPDVAARVYKNKIVPLGDSQAGDDPKRGGVNIDPVTLDGLTETEKASVTMIKTMLHGDEDGAKEIVKLMRDGLTVTQASKKVREGKAAK